MRSIVGGASVRAILLLSCILCIARPALGDEVDVLSISHDFLSLPRSLVVIAEVPQPPKPEGKLKIADRLGRLMTEALLEATQRELKKSRVVPATAAPSGAEGLLVQAYFSKLEPGSKGLRHWVGYGAGKSVLEVSGEVRDQASGRIVAKFTHSRMSWCCGYGSNDKEIKSNLSHAAEDIAAVIAGHFVRKQEYEWLADGPPSASSAPPPS